VDGSQFARFAQHQPGGRGKPGPWQLIALHSLSRQDGSCPGATDDEVLGVMGAWDDATCWVETRKLAVVREMIRRRPHPASTAGAATADPGNASAATEPGLPGAWDDELAREVSLELGISIPAAQKLIDFAWSLQTRLPGISQALAEARLKPGPARMVVEETAVLDDPAMLAQAEQMILAGLAKCRTWAELQRLVQRSVCTVDPDGARKRREQAEREHARVQFWREAAGTCAMQATGLPPDEALAAMAHVEQRAQEYRRMGIKRPIAILRVAAYLDLLTLTSPTARIARFRVEDAAAGSVPATGTEQTADPATPTEAGPGTGSPAWAAGEHLGGDRQSGERDCGSSPAFTDHGECQWDDPRDGDSGEDDECGDAGWPGSGGGDPRSGPPDPRTGAGSPGSGQAPGTGPSFASDVNLTLRHLDIPFLTAMGHAQRPGEARGLGALDPALARRLAEQAARHPDSTFCLTVVNSDGHAIGHGCCKPARRAKDRPSRGPAPPGPAPPGVAGDFTFTRSSKPGPPGGYGSWTITLPGRAGEFTVDLHPVPTGDCGHQYESPGHDPRDLLRHLVHVRDGACGFPTCSRRARESDFEHGVPFEKGGRTCGCNGWSCSRSCHRVKQSGRWAVTQPRPGWIQWRAPSGRRYTQEPWRYPA
jgi:hypothetical protein